MGTAPKGSGDRGLAERNKLMWDDQKGVGNGVVAKGQGIGSSEEDKSGVNGVAEDVNNKSSGVIQVSDGQQQTQQQQLQGPVICWQRFLPIGSLKVLLVENDDSTRHVVSALLRNCSYEVVAVANGIQAWKILEDLTNHIDLILTEVVMPFISGIGLLSKIMSHKTFKNIPVIMMSSHDSMGIVFKCLSKGAVDFLVKPIRKNELKNLWQHVWRRCHSSSGSGSGSGSGSESGTHTKKSARSKCNDEFENNSGSSDERDNGSIGLSIRDGSDNGSGTQSSWTKRAAEVDSPQATLWNQLSDAPDSTCAQVIHTKPKAFSNVWMHVTETKECQEQDLQPDNVAMGKDLEIGVSRNPDLHPEHQLEKFSIQPTSKRQNKLSELDSKPFDEAQMEDNSENMSGNMRDQAADKVSAIVNCTKPQVESRAYEAPDGHSDISLIKDKEGCDSRELPSLELSLKRLRGVEDVGANVLDDHNVLRHSDLSAFSKYNTASSANQVSSMAPQTADGHCCHRTRKGNDELLKCPSLFGNVGSCSPLDNSSVAIKTETVHSYPSRSNGIPPNQQSNGSSNNDMASTTKYVTPKPEALNDKSDSVSAFKCFHSSAFQPVQNSSVCPPQQVMPGKADDVAVSTVRTQPKGSQQQFQVQHHHHHYHHYHHHFHDVQKHQSQPDNDDLSLKSMSAAVPQCGSSNVFGEPIEGTAGNYCVNGSASGSNHGSNGQNGSSTALNTGVTNMVSDNMVAGNSGAGGTGGRIGGNGTDEERFAQREAALTKFRQKRKDRCFEKKVRYHSRKKLAEQRPRIRGQFVRQIMCDTKAEQDMQSDDLMSRENSCDR